MIILTSLTILFEILLAVQVGYLLFLTLAAVTAPRARKSAGKSPGEPSARFAVLVPAHNEERLLPELLASLRAQDYPPALFDVCVVADNCSDGTAAAARAGGARVFERFNTVQIGKGYALNWLLLNLGSANPPYSAYVIFDADTIASPGFLREMDACLKNGENAVQGYYAVRDPGQSWGVALRYAALAVLHFLRPLGRTRFGGSAGLKGNGMCFRASLYETHPWSGSVTEDIEYHMGLLLEGQRVAFAPGAFLEAEMPGSLKSAQTQNVRWESGRLQAARTYIPLLLGRLAPRRPFLALDAVMEHLIPPTAVVFLGVALCLALGGLSAALGAAWGLLWAAVGIAAALFAYIACGLILVRAPIKVWASFLYAPIYAVWKFVLMIQILLGKRRQGWVRTQR
jgi:cellulose synthase/poly-beta-1,6-N-acetylglucosamine synthase-like glycosyltransferase